MADKCVLPLWGTSKTPGPKKEGSAKVLQNDGTRNRKSSALAMFLVCKTTKGDSVKDGIAFINGLDGNVDGLYRGVFVHFEFGNEASASPQIWNISS